VSRDIYLLPFLCSVNSQTEVYSVYVLMVDSQCPVVSQMVDIPHYRPAAVKLLSPKLAGIQGKVHLVKSNGLKINIY